jgi:hypothetical protein
MRFLARMNLSEARSLIQAALERMRVAYGAVVFDEWALVGTAAKHGGVLAYTGPRIESFRQRFAADVDLLRGAAAGQPLAVGDFHFALEAEGSRHDALLRVGAGSFLVCNHIQKTMLEIRAEPTWLRAQTAFVELAEKFRTDPLVLETGDGA